MSSRGGGGRIEGRIDGLTSPEGFTREGLRVLLVNDDGGWDLVWVDSILRAGPPLRGGMR